jgi:hypothetical protein
MTVTATATRSRLTVRWRDVSTTLSQRWPTALGVIATGASLVLVSPLSERLQTCISAWCVLLAAVIYLVWGTARGDLQARRWLAVQTVGVLSFGAVAVIAAATAPAVARYVLIAGWLAHAAWDVVHHHADRVVPRWYAELCMVCDLLIAGVLLSVGTL